MDTLYEKAKQNLDIWLHQYRTRNISDKVLAGLLMAALIHIYRKNRLTEDQYLNDCRNTWRVSNKQPEPPS